MEGSRREGEFKDQGEERYREEEGQREVTRERGDKRREKGEGGEEV